MIEDPNNDGMPNILLLLFSACCRISSFIFSAIPTGRVRSGDFNEYGGNWLFAAAFAAAFAIARLDDPTPIFAYGDDAFRGISG